MVRRISVGDKFTVRDGVEVSVTRYKDTTCIEVTDSAGNLRTVNAQSLLTSRLQWRYKDGSVKKDVFTFDQLSANIKPVKTRVKREPEGDIYYVYMVHLDDVLVYIGSGKGDRFKHAVSGRSHNRHLNRVFFLRAPLIAEVVIDKLSRERSLELEQTYISRYNPIYNLNSR